MSRITMTMSCHRLCLTALLLLLFHGRAATAFSSNRVNHAIEHSPKRSNISLQMTTPSDNINDRLDVVVFGVGDLRVDDHGGLQEAMRHSSYKNVQPVVLLDPTILECIPGATCYTYDTAYMLHSALKDLERSLYSQFGLDLQVVSSVDEILSNHRSSDLHVHVCNLGPADNGMGYSPYSVLYDKHNTHDNVQIHAWTCRLREEPWNYLETLTDLYPKYKQKYVDKQDAQLPNKIMVEHHNSEKSTLTTFTSSIPSTETLIKLISTDDDTQENDFQSQANTGLYATHWGGLDPATVGESTVLKVLTEYTETCKEVDAAWTPPVARRNPYSLEHAAIEWQSPDNLIAGEYMTRFLAAPLFWGTISPRRIWHASTLNFKFQPSVLKTLVETKEWHALLAARNILVDEQYSNDNDNGLKYKYWKWHGFLCRYAEYRHDNKNAPNKKEVLLLIHGFGASSSQWKGTMEALQHSNMVMAPDLIGFGQSEKPPLSYTQYLWESYILAFGKEIGKDWESFVVGGNSIGGYTAMAVAASDVAVAGKDVSSSGATGSNKCCGVVLMNSAGQILSREDIADTDGSSTVAKITSADALPKCSPPPRSVARTLGNGLLWYLRPRIQSICKNLYPINPDAVNDELCKNILRDSLDPGAVNVMISGSKLPPPRTANELLGADYGASTNGGEGIYKGRVLVAQGMLDPLNDAKTRATMLGELREGITVSPLEAGHCPHDEVPNEVAEAINKWMQQQSVGKVESTSVASNV